MSHNHIVYQTSKRVCFFLLLLAGHTPGAVPRTTQQYRATFGLVSELRPVKNATGIFSADINGDGLGDIVTYGGHQIGMNIQTSASRTWDMAGVGIDGPIARAVCGKCNRDRNDDLIVLTDSVPRLEVLLARPRGKFTLSWRTVVDGSFDDLVSADIDNDSRTDILLYGKKELGITVYEGKGNGSFRPKTILLPEYSYSAVAVADLNADGISDIIATNWISNKILVFTGFGKMKFSEPAEIACSSEPSLLCTGAVANEHEVCIIAGFPAELSYEIIAGGGPGGFAKRQKILLSGTPSRIQPGDINADGREDICVLSSDEQSLRVDLNDGHGMIAGHVTFFAGSGPRDAALVRTHDVLNAVVLNGGTNSVRMFYNSSVKAASSVDATYGVGLEPFTARVEDLNRDGWKDIVTSNIRSHDLSLFLNDGTGHFSGPVSLGGMSSSGLFSCLPKADTAWVFIGTHPDSGNISILELNTNDFSSTTFSLPTQGTAEIVSAAIEPLSGYLRFTALERERGMAGGTLVEYERIAYARFVEKDITPQPGSGILSTAICKLDDDDTPDIVFVTYDARRHKEQVAYAMRKSSGRFSDAVSIMSFPAPEAVPANIWAYDLDRDGRDDILLNLRQPENTLMVFWSDKDSVFRRASTSIKQPVSIIRKDQLQILDVNSDGIADLVCQNDARKALQLFLRKRDGTFLPPARLAASEGLGTFILADIDNDKIPELIMTDRIQGTLQIISLEER